MTEQPHGRLRELTTQECWDHLAENSLGRIAYVDRDGPLILPFNYVVRHGVIWLRTSAYSALAQDLPGQRAAFSVDHAYERLRRGWSVLARGRVEHVPAEDYPDLLDETPDPTPWPDGTRAMVLRLLPTEVTGRALLQPDVSPEPGHGPGTTQRHGEHRPSLHVPS